MIAKVLTGPDGNELAGGMPIWHYYPTKPFKRFDEANKTVYEISKKMVDKAIENLKQEKNKTEEDLSILQKFINRCGYDSQIPVVMSQDAIMAGVDTTGTTGAFFLLDLARNPDKQEILYQEISQVIGDGSVTEQKLNQLKYLKACLHESQRLNPAVFGSSRTTQHNMVLEGYQIPPDTVVR